MMTITRLDNILEDVLLQNIILKLNDYNIANINAVSKKLNSMTNTIIKEKKDEAEEEYMISSMMFMMSEKM